MPVPEPQHTAPADSSALAGLEIAITGKLAAMTREEAITAIEQRGGRYVPLPGPTTDLLVVGSEGWPLQKDGHLTRSLQAAHQMEQRGHQLRIASEAEFLAEAALFDLRDELHRLYTTEQLARILELPVARLRGLVQRGLVRPQRVARRLCYFDFAEVARARALVGLLDRGATVQALRRSLVQLRHWLPDAANALAQLERMQRGSALVLRRDDGRIVEPDGQLRFDFGEVGPDRQPTIHSTRDASLPPRRTGPEDARLWFARGIACEDEGELEQALDAYHRAQLAAGAQPEICFNLGNVLHALGQTGAAAQRYQMAVELDPEYVEAWNNLGNALGELRRFDQAFTAYHSALALEPHYADAHYNLAETHQQIGRFAEAQHHWQAYLDEAPHAGDRSYVERMLRECQRHL